MASSDKEAILVLDKENNIAPDLKEHDLYFSEPNLNLKPYLDLLDEECELELNNEKIILSSDTQKMKIFTCEPEFVNTFSANEPNVDFMFTTEMREVYNYFSSLKKIASRFGKIYITNNEGKISLETTDKENPYANSVSFDFLSNEVDKNFSIPYDFKYMNSLFNIISIDDFELSMAYLEEQEAGLLMINNKDGSEKFYIISKTSG